MIQNINKDQNIISGCFQKVFRIELFVTFRKHPQRNYVYNISGKRVNPIIQNQSKIY